uniref:C2H2-type domain-containing protein n=1 Tax=Neolamprologus brichardi TaxID=32507 RepID=A0A3Q4GPC7_NEOBR
MVQTSKYFLKCLFYYHLFPFVYSDALQQHAFEEEEILTDQHVFNQERNSSLDQEKPENPQIKEDQEELCSNQKGEQLGLKQDADTFMVTPAYQESAYSKPEPNSEQLLSHSSPEAETRDNEESQHVDSGTTRNTELNKRRHSQRVDNLTSVQCEVCGKTLQDKYNMITHLRVHTDEKPYSCSTCGKRFADLSTFKKHKRIHKGEKPYSCDTCGKTFATSLEVKRHTRIHTGEKQYPCSTSGKRFVERNKLKKHMRIHTRESFIKFLTLFYFAPSDVLMCKPLLCAAFGWELLKLNVYIFVY